MVSRQRVRVRITFARTVEIRWYSPGRPCHRSTAPDDSWTPEVDRVAGRRQPGATPAACGGYCPAVAVATAHPPAAAWAATPPPPHHRSPGPTPPTLPPSTSTTSPSTRSNQERACILSDGNQKPPPSSHSTQTRRVTAESIHRRAAALSIVTVPPVNGEGREQSPPPRVCDVTR